MRFEEKEECNGCLYSEYDYDGKETYFLACRKGEKCTGCIKPKGQAIDVEMDGRLFRVSQTEWLGYEGVCCNLVVLEKQENGEWQERLHAGKCKGFLNTEEAADMCRIVISFDNDCKKEK